MENLASKLPSGIGYDWTGMSYQERLSGNQAPALYAISLIVVFLCLAALYESWSIPFSVMLVVPLGVIGALLAASMRGLNNDVYFRVGLLTTIGLSAKNAILIVEFAKDLMDKEGKGIIEATLEASRMRLRPILMTSGIHPGVMPLVISSGAGSGAQNAVGTGVMGGCSQPPCWPYSLFLFSLWLSGDDLQSTRINENHKGTSGAFLFPENNVKHIPSSHFLH